MSSFIGNKLQLCIYGESHGASIGAVVHGLPSGIKIDMDVLNTFVSRRKPNQNKYTTKRNEKDDFEILSGYFEGHTTGTPLAIEIKNENMKSKDYKDISDNLRPSHADYTGYLRYKGYNDYRGGGHFSGRLTAPLCVVGGIAVQILEKLDIFVCSHISSLYNIIDTPIHLESLAAQQYLTKKEVPFFDDENIDKAKILLDKILHEKDSVGGIVEIMVHNMKEGLGSPFFDSLESRISHMIFSIPSVKGLEFGSGFESTMLKGSQNNDEFEIVNDKIRTKTNNDGGINGGISNGMPIVMKVAIKPTPSIAREQNTVNIRTMKDTKLEIKGRHDPAIILRIPPVLESAVAITILDVILEEKPQLIEDIIPLKTDVKVKKV